MNQKVFVSCAVTGSGDTASKHPGLPKTPEQIAKAAIEAAKAGAAIAHIHVREDDGRPSRRLELYKEVVDRIRSNDTDIIINLTSSKFLSKHYILDIKTNMQKVVQNSFVLFAILVQLS